MQYPQLPQMTPAIHNQNEKNLWIHGVWSSGRAIRATLRTKSGTTETITLGPIPEGTHYGDYLGPILAGYPVENYSSIRHDEFVYRTKDTLITLQSVPIPG